MKVQEIMTVDPVCCSKFETAQTAARMMKEHNVGIIPVVESEKSYKLVGVITDRDLCLSIVAEGKDPSTIRLEDCVIAPLVWCEPQDDLSKAIKLMQENQIRRLPVLDRDSCIQGIISTADIALYSDLTPDEFEQAIMGISKEHQSANKDRDTFGAFYIAPGGGACVGLD